MCKKAKGFEDLAKTMKRVAPEDGDQPTLAVASSHLHQTQLLELRAVNGAALARDMIGLQRIIRNVERDSGNATRQGKAFCGLWWCAGIDFDNEATMTTCALAPLLVHTGQEQEQMQVKMYRALKAFNDMIPWVLGFRV